MTMIDNNALWEFIYIFWLQDINNILRIPLLIVKFYCIYDGNIQALQFIHGSRL